MLKYFWCTDDVEVTFELKATPEQVEKARGLQLPDNFFLYEDGPSCPGCPGCKEDPSVSVLLEVNLKLGSLALEYIAQTS